MSTKTTPTIFLSSDLDFEKERYQSSSYFDNIGFCHVFDCLEGWSSFFGGRPENDKVNTPKGQQHAHSRGQTRIRPRIDPDLFRNPLAEKMVKDAVQRSKFNTKSQREMMNPVPNYGYLKDHHDKNDELLDQKIALAARKKRQRQQVQPHSSAISYSRRQHRILHQQKLAKQQQKHSQQETQSPLSKLNCRKKPEPERPQTPMPIPGPSRLNPKISKRTNQIVPKRRTKSSTMTLLKRKDANESKRQSPPTSYCPPVSTPLVPIGERKAIKEKKHRSLIRRNSKVTPSFQPDEYY